MDPAEGFLRKIMIKKADYLKLALTREGFGDSVNKSMSLDNYVGVRHAKFNKNKSLKRSRSTKCGRTL